MENTEELQLLLSSEDYSFRFDAGVSMPFTSVKFEDKEEIATCIAKHFLIYMCKGELDQLKNGVKHLGVHDLMLKNPALFRPLLTDAGKIRLTSSTVLKSFNIDWSPRGSNQWEDEQAIILNWTDYVNELESKYYDERLITCLKVSNILF